MSVTKHKIFKLPVDLTDSGEYSISEKANKLIEDFLMDSNIVYVGHSLTVLGRDTSKVANDYKDEVLLISLVYKDLKDTPNQVTSVTKRTKQLIHKDIEKGETMPMPDIVTSFESDIASKK